MNAKLQKKIQNVSRSTKHRKLRVFVIYESRQKRGQYTSCILVLLDESDFKLEAR